MLAIILGGRKEATMPITSPEEKRRIAELLSKPGRPMRNIAKLTRGNSAPNHNAESLEKRSRETAPARAKRYMRVLRAMSTK